MRDAKTQILYFFASLFLCLFSAGCTSGSIFDPLGENVAGPNGIAIDSDSNRLYLINSNSNVLYDWHEGSVQILDITTPLTPSLIDTVETASFSGAAVIDAERKLLYVTNRFSEQTTVTEDHLLVLNIDESSGNFLNVSTSIIGKDPYGISCCYPEDRMWIATSGDVIDYIDLGDLSTGSASLLRRLSNGGMLTKAESPHIAIIGNMAFLPRTRGGLLVVNLDEVPDSGKNPVDYWIEDLRVPSGIATDGTYLYVADQEVINNTWTPLLLIIDPSSLTPLTDNETTLVLDKDDDGLLVAQVEVDKEPQNVFLTSSYAFVTCNNEGEDGLVSVVDLASQTLQESITVGKEPFGMALYAPGGVEQYLYVGNVESNTLSVIDINSLTLAGTYP